MKKHVWLLVAVVIVAFIVAKVIAIAAFGEVKDEQALTAPMLPCQLEQGCQLGVDATVKAQEKLRLNEPFHIELHTNEPIDAVSVSFSMVDMEIGYNRYKLVSTDGKTWTAKISLPICTLNRADYIATWRMGDKKFQTALNVTR